LVFERLAIAGVELPGGNLACRYRRENFNRLAV